MVHDLKVCDREKGIIHKRIEDTDCRWLNNVFYYTNGDGKIKEIYDVIEVNVVK